MIFGVKRNVKAAGTVLNIFKKENLSCDYIPKYCQGYLNYAMNSI